MDSQKERRKLILTNKSYAGRKLRELKTLRTDGVIISRVSRLGFTFVPTGDTTLERNDVLTVVGSPENLTKYGDKIGHRSQDMNQTDLLSLGFGLSMGIILGLVNFSFGNGLGISLGIAGGPPHRGPAARPLRPPGPHRGIHPAPHPPSFAGPGPGLLPG